MKVSSNIQKGDPISDLRELSILAHNRESVVAISNQHGHAWVRPAAFFLQWKLDQLLRMSFFHSQKIKK